MNTCEYCGIVPDSWGVCLCDIEGWRDETVYVTADSWDGEYLSPLG